MRSMLFAASVAIVCVSLSACGGWKSGQANSAQGNISKDSRPPATAKASVVTNSTNGMMLLAVALPRDRALHVMKVRHDGMEQIGKDTKAIVRELKGGSPNLGIVRGSASDIDKLAQKAAGWFPLGTGPDVAKTRAKPEIWQNAQDFSSKLRNLQVAARAFDAAARSGNVGAINARFADLGGACKACHDKYRAEEQH
jgi:cytochrome c556